MPVAVPEVTQTTQPNTFHIVFCRGFVDNAIFGLDSEFIANRERVFAVVKGTSNAPLELVWYAGGQEKARMSCPSSLSCQASLGPDTLQVGNWSVDLVRGRTLITSRQFRMLSP